MCISCTYLHNCAFSLKNQIETSRVKTNEMFGKPNPRHFSTFRSLLKETPTNLKGRKKSSQDWLTRQLKDPYVEKAKLESYRFVAQACVSPTKFFLKNFFLNLKINKFLFADVAVLLSFCRLMRNTNFSLLVSLSLTVEHHPVVGPKWLCGDVMLMGKVHSSSSFACLPQIFIFCFGASCILFLYFQMVMSNSAQ